MEGPISSKTDSGKESSTLNVQQHTRQQMGVALNQRPITNTSTKDGHDESLTHTDEIIHEPGWTLENILDRFKYVGSYPIPSSEPSGKIVQKFRVPHDLVINNVTTLAPFQSFKYWSGHVEINAQLAASPGVQGCLAMVYVPLTDSTFIESNILTNFSAMSINQNCYLFPNSNTAANMVIPFNSPFSMLDLSDPPENPTPRDNLGYLYFVVFNQFELSANTSDDTHVSLFVNFHSSQFKVPRLNGTSGSIRRVKAESEDASRKEPVSGSASVLDTIEKAIVPNELITDGFKTISTLFGLDKPAVQESGEPTKVRSTQYMNNANGLDYIDKMCIYPQAVTTVSPKSFATTTDEMEFRYLFSKFSYLGTFSVSVDDGVGKVVGSFPLSPTPNILSYKPEGEISPISKVPLLQYVSLPFQFWNGALNYRMQVVSTMMQSCKLFVGLNYGTFLPSNSTNMNETTSQYGQIIEINQGSNTFDFKAEYIAQTPMLHLASSNQPSEYDSMGYVNIAVLNKLISGYGSPKHIHINVFIAGGDNFNVNTLTPAKAYVPTTAKLTQAQNLRIEELYNEVSDDSDFEVIKKYKSRKILRAKAQSAAQPIITPMSEVNLTEEPEATAPSTGDRTRPTTAQPYIQSVRHLLRKYQMAASIPLLGDGNVGGTVYRIDISSLLHRSNAATFPSYNPEKGSVEGNLGNFTHYQKLFRQFNGSLSFKIMTRTLSEFSVYYSPPIYNKFLNNLSHPVGDLFSHTLYPFDGLNPPNAYGSNPDHVSLPHMTRLPVVYVNSPNRTAEFNVPFSSRLHSILSSQGPLAENTLTHSELINMGDIFIVAHKPMANDAIQGHKEFNPSFDVFFCLGDDARFGNLFNVPYLTSRYSVDTTNDSLMKPSEPDDLTDIAVVTNTLKILP